MQRISQLFFVIARFGTICTIFIIKTVNSTSGVNGLYWMYRKKCYFSTMCHVESVVLKILLRATQTKSPLARFQYRLKWMKKKSCISETFVTIIRDIDAGKVPENKIEYQNIGAKVLSARLTKVLNLLITSLITWLCTVIENVLKSGEIRQRTTTR